MLNSMTAQLDKDCTNVLFSEGLPEETSFRETPLGFTNCIKTFGTLSYAQITPKWSCWSCPVPFWWNPNFTEMCHTDYNFGLFWSHRIDLGPWTPLWTITILTFTHIKCKCEALCPNAIGYFHYCSVDNDTVKWVICWCSPEIVFTSLFI